MKKLFFKFLDAIGVKKECEQQKSNGGSCPLHNIHCAYPACIKWDRK